MSSKATSAASPAKESVVNQRDAAVIIAAFQSLKTSPQVDYEVLAALAGFKNARTASTIVSNSYDTCS
ncbi:hypothetical protein F5X96DRAFT_693037 [Biscogniauxia mediterranea]|nr:hypothetical protein F5X96DRAFT_693037 [Biscogniauxia mediterranea]